MPGVAPDMRGVLEALVGRTVPTLMGKRNSVLRVHGDVVIVGTDRSPNGQPVEIADIQGAANELFRRGELEINVASVGHRSAFVGAVLATLPGTIAETKPRRILLPRA